MRRRPPRATRTDTLFPSTTLVRSHGGRHSELRAPGTRAALIALRDGGIISGDVAADLDAAYVLFRTIEHRLQMVEDQQHHHLPKHPEELARPDERRVGKACVSP